MSLNQRFVSPPETHTHTCHFNFRVSGKDQLHKGHDSDEERLEGKNIGSEGVLEHVNIEADRLCLWVCVVLSVLSHLY